MTVSASNNAVDIKALIYALTQQRESLPHPVQHSLKQAGQALQQNRPEAGYQLRERIKSYTPLDVAYTDALQDLDRQYHSQERIKSIGATFADSAGLDWFFINDVIPAADWVSTAKQVLPKPSSRSEEYTFGDRLNRVFIIAMGGACIGAAIAQLPGAIVVGCAALAYGWWYVNAYQSKKARILK